MDFAKAIVDQKLRLLSPQKAKNGFLSCFSCGSNEPAAVPEGVAEMVAYFESYGFLIV